MKNTLLYSVIILLSVLFLNSCKKNKTGEPPVLPPYESMIIDFSNFTSQKKSSAQIINQKGTENSSWEFAATVSGIWSSLISSTLDVPINAYKFSAGNSPKFISDKNWQWSYSFSLDGTDYKAKLTGEIGKSSVFWKMYITKEGTGGYTDFPWFEGTTNSDGLAGQWIFNQSYESQGVILRCDWIKSGSMINSVKYTYIKNDTNLNSNILYRLTTGSLNAAYAIHFANALYSDADIEWNTTTENGRIKCTDYLQDDNWYCWDSNKINIVCPQ